MEGPTAVYGLRVLRWQAREERRRRRRGEARVTVGGCLVLLPLPNHKCGCVLSAELPLDRGSQREVVNNNFSFKTDLW